MHWAAAHCLLSLFLTLTTSSSSSLLNQCFLPQVSTGFVHFPNPSPTTGSNRFAASCSRDSLPKITSFSVERRFEHHSAQNFDDILQNLHHLSLWRRSASASCLFATQTSTGDGEGGGIRINKCFKEFASRRQADRFVQDGRVCINGAVASLTDRVFRGDKVTLDGDLVRWEQLNLVDTSKKNGKQSEEPFVYIKYWKPRGVVCTTDTRIRGNIIDRIRHPERIFPVGRLDKDSSGLILLTSDGRVPNAVLRSGQRHDKRYFVRANRALDPRDVEELASGVVITTVAQRDGGRGKELTAPTLPCRVRQTGSRSIEIVLQVWAPLRKAKEGRNRQIRKMMEALGYDVVDLHREEVMGIDLSGLRVGEWKNLNRKEMDLVRRAIEAPPKARMFPSPPRAA